MTEIKLGMSRGFPESEVGKTLSVHINRDVASTPVSIFKVLVVVPEDQTCYVPALLKVDFNEMKFETVTGGDFPIIKLQTTLVVYGSKELVNEKKAGGANG